MRKSQAAHGNLYGLLTADAEQKTGRRPTGGGLNDSADSEYDNQQHFELLLAVDGMRMAGGHDDRLALVQNVRLAVDGDAADAVQAGDKRVAAGLMRADFFALAKGKSVTLMRGFWASVLLTTWPSW